MHYYLLVYPAEALVASMLTSAEFSAYMSMGPEKTAAEQLIFVELTEEFGDDFDWDYARRACIPHRDGTPKNSVYLSVYRVLERVPHRVLGNLSLVTQDGRNLEIAQRPYRGPQNWTGHALYQELCPVSPLVAATLPPEPFSRYLLDSTNHIAVPAIAFADIHLPGPENQSLYAHDQQQHVQMCFDDIHRTPGKLSKTIDRSAKIQFSYRTIGQGLFFARHKEPLVFYPMPSADEIRSHHDEWGRSAHIFS